MLIQIPLLQGRCRVAIARLMFSQCKSTSSSHAVSSIEYDACRRRQLLQLLHLPQVEHPDILLVDT